MVQFSSLGILQSKCFVLGLEALQAFRAPYELSIETCLNTRNSGMMKVKNGFPFIKMSR